MIFKFDLWYNSALYNAKYKDNKDKSVLVKLGIFKNNYYINELNSLITKFQKNYKDLKDFKDKPDIKNNIFIQHMLSKFNEGTPYNYPILKLIISDDLYVVNDWVTLYIDGYSISFNMFDNFKKSILDKFIKMRNIKNIFSKNQLEICYNGTLLDANLAQKIFFKKNIDTSACVDDMQTGPININTPRF